MIDQAVMQHIATDLDSLSRFETVIFGSLVDGTSRMESDIDVAIITRERDRDTNIGLYKGILGRFPPPYEVRVFELLPLEVKMSIIDDFEVIFGDRCELSEYFYSVRKTWEDCKHRILQNQFSSYKEKQELQKNREKVSTVLANTDQPRG